MENSNQSKSPLSAPPIRWLLPLAAAVLLVFVAFQTEPPAGSPAQSTTSTPDHVEWLHDIVTGTGGGRPIHVEVARPKQIPDKPMPAVLIVHGGGWVAGDYKGSRFAPFLAAHGYFAVVVEYRLSGESKWPAQIEDCKLAVRWLRANAAKYHVDPDRIAAEGASAGGHLVSCLATMDDNAGFEGSGGWPGVSSRVCAVIDMNGPVDFNPDFEPDSLFGATYAEKPALFKAASPINYVRPGLPPFLVIHGDADDTVPFNQSEKFVDALQNAGVPVKFMIMHGAGHNLSAPPVNRVILWNDMLAWLNEMLKK